MAPRLSCSSSLRFYLPSLLLNCPCRHSKIPLSTLLCTSASALPLSVSLACAPFPFRRHSTSPSTAPFPGTWRVRVSGKRVFALKRQNQTTYSSTTPPKSLLSAILNNKQSTYFHTSKSRATQCSAPQHHSGCPLNENRAPHSRSNRQQVYDQPAWASVTAGTQRIEASSSPFTRPTRPLISPKSNNSHYSRPAL